MCTTVDEAHVCQARVSCKINKVLLIVSDIVLCWQCQMNLISCYSQKMPCNPVTIRSEQTVWQFSAWHLASKGEWLVFKTDCNTRELCFATYPTWSETNWDVTQQLVSRTLQGGSELVRGWPLCLRRIWEMKLKQCTLCVYSTWKMLNSLHYAG
jgi:hypothetical protein